MTDRSTLLARIADLERQLFETDAVIVSLYPDAAWTKKSRDRLNARFIAAQGIETRRAETSEAQAPGRSPESPVPEGNAL